MGVIKKSLRLKIAQGDTRKVGKRKLEEQLDAVPKAPRGLPADCPRHLNGHARRAWAFLKGELEAMHLDHRPDALALEAGCLAYGAAIDAEEVLAREGATVLIAGDPKKHPATSVRNAAWSRFTQFCDRFGLSPRARESLSIETPADAHAELMEILSRPRTPRIAPRKDIQ